MQQLKISPKAKKIIDRLIKTKKSKMVGYIAAIDPQTGDHFFGKTITEAAKNGRRVKKNPKAVFFFVRIGSPSVHVLKTVKLQGKILNDYFPTVQGYVQNKNLHLISSIPKDKKHLEFIADTGFSGNIVIDTNIISRIDTDYLGEDMVTLAGGLVCPVSVYLSDIIVNTFKLKDVEITEMKNEYLLGVSFMKSICKYAIFDFNKEEVLFKEN